MSSIEITASVEPASHGEQDLGPLAWVLDELRKSLEGAVKATRLFVRDAQEARASDLAALDNGPLRMAKQQLHQSSGALEMVGMPQPALLLRAMESALQHYVQHPDHCTEAVAQTLEKASFALLEFLAAVLAGTNISAVALFPQYRDVQALCGQEGKVHPADLWPVERRLRDPQLPDAVAPLSYTPAQRQVLDTAVLQIVKGQETAAASLRIRDVCLGFAQAQSEAPMRIFWKVTAAFFDALGHGLLKTDIYTKRVASRVLMVSAALAKGSPVAPERLLQDMLFFCAQAGGDSRAAQGAQVWQAVYAGFDLQRHGVVNYEQVRFGRFDPALLAQARKRIAAATDIWSTLAGGDAQKIKPALDQFTLVCDSLTKLHPESHSLAKALMQVMHSVVASGQPPSAEVAMEVATAVLYLQAAFAALDLADEAMAQHGATLAQRLTAVLAGEAAQPLAPWMEQLYRQVSDQQTMGSVVGELRCTLAEAEKLLDQHFRQPADTSMLGAVAAHLSQMRGVLSVLGLDQASLAMVRMRQNVERLQQAGVPEDEQRQLFEKMGNSLGALGFLIDMLSYQRNMARKLYVFDEQAGELKLLMGRMRVRIGDAASSQPVETLVQARVEQIVQPVLVPKPAVPQVLHVPGADSDASGQPAAAPGDDLSRDGSMLPPFSEPVPQPEPASPAAPAVAVLQLDSENTDQELLGIFLEEAREVVAHGRTALQVLAEDPANLSEQTVLRRAFHTLKGSSRMVGLDEFGQAGWAMEQMLNAWLAEQKAMPAPMQTLSLQALNGFEAWAQAIEADAGQSWQSAPFRASADAMRLDGRWIALDMQAVQGMPRSDVAEPVAQLQQAQDLAAETLSLLEDAAQVPAMPVPEYEEPEAATISLQEWDTLLQAANGAQADTGESVEAFQQGRLGEAAAPMPALASAEPAMVEPEVAEVPPPAMKQVGDLRVPLPLFNVYLNEAEEWSHHLLDALTVWQEHPNASLPEMAITWAHSLAGSSATVGFASLSQLARKLEHALQHVQPQAQSEPWQVQSLVRAAEEIRGLLHQFAAGFLPTPASAVVSALQHILDTDVPTGLERAPNNVPDSAGDEATELEVDIETKALPRLAMPEAQQQLPAQDIQALDARIDAAMPPYQAHVLAENDDLDAVDAIDPDLFPIFEEEGQELMPTLGTALREWAAHPTRWEAHGSLLRALHTLKGSARLAGAMRLGEMAHRLESALEALDTETVTSEQIEPLFVQLDAMEADFKALRMAQLAGEAGLEHSASAATPDAATFMAAEGGAVEAPEEARARLAAAPAAPQPVWPAGARHGAQQSVRVRSQLLDRLINEAGEVMIARSRLDERVGSIKGSLHDLTQNLDKLRQQLRDIEVQAESQMQSRMQLSKDAGADFDPLEFDRFTRVQELTRMMAESVNDVATVQRNLLRDVTGAEDDLIAQGRQARELQRDLLRTRMVEFDAISERLYAVVRLVSKDTGKQVKLGLSGATIEMDRGVLERMVPAFEHLLRNCVDHGIELPAQRSAAGKPVAGMIDIHVQHDGNDVAVTFKDDGAGLNVERIRDKALALGLVEAHETVDAARAAELVFMPGFSTAEQLSDISGRGIGMDVVRAEVQALGGRIETQSTPGQGTSFRLVLPLTTAVTQVVMLRAGDFSVGVPASLVGMVRRVHLPDLEAAYRSGSLLDAGEQIPFYWAGAVWSQSPRSLEAGTGKTRPVVIFRSASQRIALHVDEVLGHQEVVVKNLGPQMSRLPGLTGMSVLASGAVVLIYNPVALAAVYGEQIRQLGEGLPAVLDAQTAKQLQRDAMPQAPISGMAATSQVPLVLVVDDSITVRRVSQRLLQREGYRVVTAADGLQALEKLQDEVPCVVLSDIEMPRMDGFDLLRHIRAQAPLQRLPVIMITSRMAQKHRDLAMSLGANHYLGKPYGDEELMGLIHHYAVGRPLPVGNSS